MSSPHIVQLYIFKKAPRALPPCFELEGLGGKQLVRALRRAALHPWRDAKFWRQAAVQVEAIPPGDLLGRDFAQICTAFRRIDFASPVLSDYCEAYIQKRKQALNTFELASVLSYHVSASGGQEETKKFAKQVADEVCIEWRQREVVPWSAWKMLVCAAVQSGEAHTGLFKLASPALASNVQFMTAREVTEICEAYAAFRFKHQALLSEVSRFVPSMGLRDHEVKSLQGAFQTLNFEAPMLQRIHELRTYAGG